MIKIVVAGALGRMGKRIIELAEKDPELKVLGKIEKEAYPKLGIVSDPKEVKSPYDCIIDFTAPLATMKLLKDAENLKKAIVIGTTGLSSEEMKLIYKSSKNIPVVFSPNMSVGVNVFFNLIEKSALSLGNDYKVRISETHHIHKKDKPSGTARFMKEIVEKKLDGVEIPVESIRMGEVIGDHEIIFESAGDTIKISHSAKTRDILALGALKAAKFVSKKQNGIYSMREVLGL